MLSIATLHSATYYLDASESFSYYGGRDDQQEFEIDPPGVWTGELARRYFGDGATVQRKDFAALYFGFDPRTGQAITKSSDALGYAAWQAEETLGSNDLSAAEQKPMRQQLAELRAQLRERNAAEGWRGHRAGIDLTFSAPKDFSLLVAAAGPTERNALLAAFRRSVEATLTTAEQRYAKTRLRDEAGSLCKEGIAGAAVGIFEHIAARPVDDHPPDPDVHLHCVVMSPVLCHDAATRTLFSNDLRLNLKVLDAEARARLAQELRRMGYALNEDRQKNCTSFHLPGISPSQREQYSKRRGEILAGMNSGEFKTSAVAAIGTRQGKADWTRAESLVAWQRAFAPVGLTAERLIQARADKAPAARSDDEIIESLLEREAFFSARQVRQMLWEEAQFADVPAGMDVGDWIDARANQLLKRPDLLIAQLPDGSSASSQRTGSGDDEPIFTTRSLLRREIALDDEVQALGQRAGHRIGWDDAAFIVELLEARKSEAAQAAASANGQPLPSQFAYRDDQKAAIAKILAGPDIGWVQAFAGTGKTTAAAAMIEVYRAHGKKVIALAPSNKAAGQLSEDCQLKGDDKATTVDAFLLSTAKDKVNADTVMFLDEASMLGFDNAEALVQLARTRGAKIIFQGDTQQLPSVQRGRFFLNGVAQLLGTASAELTLITRQREEWARAATIAAERGDFATTLALLDEHQMIHTEGTDEAVLDRIAYDHLADPQPDNQKLIVATRNADVAALNRRIRRELVATGKVDEGVACLAGKEHKQAMRIGRGDRIIFTDTLKSGRQKLAVNGSIGTVFSVTASDKGLRVQVRLDGECRLVEFTTDDFSAIAHAWAVTTHKAQGATTESCRFLYSDYISSELAVVATSRHRSSFGLYCRADKRQDMAKWMGRRIEKLDARDLVSLADLNDAARSLRAGDEKRAHSIRDYIKKRLPIAFRAVEMVAKNLPRVKPFALPAAASICLDGLRRHQQRLTDYLANLRKPSPPSGILDIATKLNTRRQQTIPPVRSAKEVPRS